MSLGVVYKKSNEVIQETNYNNKHLFTVKIVILQFYNCEINLVFRQLPPISQITTRWHQRSIIELYHQGN